MDQTFPEKAIFVGCARDCARAIPRVFANVARMSSLFAQSAYIFVENDSQDSTKHELQLWCRDKTNAHLVSLDGLSAACPIRTIRLATARNRYLSMLRSGFREYDYVFSLDCDEVNAAEIDLDGVRRAVEFLRCDAGHAGVFANSEGIYYDMWALRHSGQCPGDVWEEVCDYAFSNHVSDEVAFRETFSKRVFSLPLDSRPFEVDSAFGGLGIYKVPSLLRNGQHFVGHKPKLIPAGVPGLTGSKAREIGWQCCEHVSFNRGFRDNGERLFVLPWLVNVHLLGVRVQFPAAVWRTMLFGPLPPGGLVHA